MPSSFAAALHQASARSQPNREIPIQGSGASLRRHPEATEESAGTDEDSGEGELRHEAVQRVRDDCDEIYVGMLCRW